MDETNRKLLAEVLKKHETCLHGIETVTEQGDIIARLVEIEQLSWSESALEVENRPMTYRFLLSKLQDLALVEERYAACEHDYLKAIAAQRYAELLSDVTDMERLMELAVRVQPMLRPFVILQLQAKLPAALKGITPDALPKWFVHLLRQPHEVSNFFSQATCSALMKKVQSLLR